jgi:hypothetical protein
LCLKDCLQPLALHRLTTGAGRVVTQLHGAE